MVLSEATENYLTAILRLEEAQGAAATSNLARYLEVAPASVTGMLKKLAREGLVEHRRYRGTQLTRSGRRAALKVIRSHRLVETFLVRALGVAPERVHAEAHRWEHALSDEVVDRLDLWLGRPSRDPHGTPIPSRRHRAATKRRLTTLAAGERGVVVAVEGSDEGHATYLQELGFAPGVQIHVLKRRPYGGPLTLALADRQCTVGSEVTEYITIRREE
jgi:DtxR family Mn-dependent transcriptional regulator